MFHLVSQVYFKSLLLCLTILFGHKKIPNSVVADWIYILNGLTFYAPDLVSVKKFVDILFNRRYEYIKEYFLLETIVPIRKNGIKNPQIKDLVNYI